MLSFIFRKAKAEEVDKAFDLVVARMRWMDKKGIRQWNVTGYIERFPHEYYADQQRRGNLYVLAESTTGRIVCIGVVKPDCDRWIEEGWKDIESALYIHNLASAPDCPGAGGYFLLEAEDMARRMGKAYFRLDSAADNGKINAYYDQRGYDIVGTCRHGLYHGLLRQKSLGGDKKQQ